MLGNVTAPHQALILQMFMHVLFIITELKDNAQTPKIFLNVIWTFIYYCPPFNQLIYSASSLTAIFACISLSPPSHHSCNFHLNS